MQGPPEPSTFVVVIHGYLATGVDTFEAKAGFV
jgi:hypothetical protein